MTAMLGLPYHDHIISAMPPELVSHKHHSERSVTILAICMSSGDTCALLSVSLQRGQKLQLGVERAWWSCSWAGHAQCSGCCNHNAHAVRHVPMLSPCMLVQVDQLADMISTVFMVHSGTNLETFSHLNKSLVITAAEIALHNFFNQVMRPVPVTCSLTFR